MWTKSICPILFSRGPKDFCCTLFSRDVTICLFRLYWILFPEMFQLAITSLLEDIQMFCASQIAPQSPDSSPKILPPGYFVSTGSCFQRCPNWLLLLFWDIQCFVLAKLHHSLPTLLQRCYHLVISSLLDLVSRDVSTGYFVSSGGFQCICALFVHHSLP